MDGKKLVEDASKGDVVAFSKLVKKYSNALFSVVYSIIGDYYQAQDIVQESFIKAYLNLGSLKNGAKFGSWMYSITKRISIDWVRKQKDWLPFQDDARLTDETIEDYINRQDISSEVRRALLSLDEPNRITMILFYISDFTSKEIAHFLDISTSAVESRIKRSKILLKNRLSGLDEIFGNSLAKNKLPSTINENIIRKIPNLVRVPRITISVNDIDNSTSWYENVLGIEFNRGLADVGGVHVGLTMKKNEISFLTSDLWQAYIALKESRIKVSEWNENQDYFSFEDFEGNKIMVAKMNPPPTNKIFL